MEGIGGECGEDFVGGQIEREKSKKKSGIGY